MQHLQSPLTLQDRDKICLLLCQQYTIPDDYKDSIKTGIKKHSTRINTLDNTLNNYVNESQTLLNKNALSFLKSGNSLSQWHGLVDEWIACFEYNEVKNRYPRTNNITQTIVNPDPTSKTDLLHIININSGYITRPGGDVKTGKPRYVLEQYKKNINLRRHIPFLDFSGHLTASKEKSLTPSQLNELNEIQYNNPNKKPVAPILSANDRLHIKTDLLIFLNSDFLPSKADKTTRSLPTTRAERNALYDKATKKVEKGLPTKSWNQFSLKAAPHSNETKASEKTQPHKQSEPLKDSNENRKYKNNSTKNTDYSKGNNVYNMNDFKRKKYGYSNENFKETHSFSNNSKSVFKNFLAKASNYVIQNPHIIGTAFSIIRTVVTRKPMPNQKLNINRDSPMNHMVQAHQRTRNGKTFDVRSYTRGKK